MNVFDSTIFKTSSDKKILYEPDDCQRYIDTICDNTTNAFIVPCYNNNYVTIHVEGSIENMVDNVMLILRSWINKHYTREVFERKNILFLVNDLETRDYDYKEYPSYLNLMEQLSVINYKNISRDNFHNFVDNLNENHKIKVIRYKHTNQIVGSITILKENKIIHDLGKVGHIEDLVVDKSVRNYGLGKKLVEIAVKECQDCYKVILDCSDEYVKFYEKCGFKWKGNQLALYK